MAAERVTCRDFETSWALSPFHPVKQLLHYRDCGWINNKAFKHQSKDNLKK